MRKTLTLLVASTALTAAIGLPAWSAMHAPADGSLRPVAAPFEERAQALPLILASDDDDDDNRGYVQSSRRGHDDDDDDDDDCDDDDDDECRGGARQSRARRHRRTSAERALRERRPAAGPGELSLSKATPEQGPTR